MGRGAGSGLGQGLSFLEQGLEQALAQGFQGLQDWQGELQGEGAPQLGLACIGRAGRTGGRAGMGDRVWNGGWSGM